MPCRVRYSVGKQTLLLISTLIAAGRGGRRRGPRSSSAVRRALNTASDHLFSPSRQPGCSVRVAVLRPAGGHGIPRGPGNERKRCKSAFRRNRPMTAAANRGRFVFVRRGTRFHVPPVLRRYCDREKSRDPPVGKPPSACLSSRNEISRKTPSNETLVRSAARDDDDGTTARRRLTASARRPMARTYTYGIVGRVYPSLSLETGAESRVIVA